jgi:hypothetical protein
MTIMMSATSEYLVRHVRVLLKLRLIWRETGAVLGYLLRRVEICDGVSEKLIGLIFRGQEFLVFKTP